MPPNYASSCSKSRGNIYRRRRQLTETAELGEPGAMDALIALKLSANAQFQDRPGACRLIETAVGRGDQSMTQRLADYRAN